LVSGGEVTMALSDCEKCWETPCVCGREYKTLTEDQVIKKIEDLMRYHDRKSILQKLNETKVEPDKRLGRKDLLNNLVKKKRNHI
jgi:hypothetical protein